MVVIFAVDFEVSKMNKILVTDLNINHSLFSDLSLAETQTIWGEGQFHNFPYPGITTVQGNVNSLEITHEGVKSSHDNKIRSLDYSKSTYINII